MSRLLLGLAFVACAGCATRGTISELGRPEFANVLPKDLQLTLVEPRVDGEFHAFPKGAGEGDYHVSFKMERPLQDVGQGNVGLIIDAIPTGGTQIKLFAMILWPLLARDEAAFKRDGHPPGKPEPLRSVSMNSPVPDHEYFGLQAGFLKSKLDGFDEVGVSYLVQFQDGWVSILDRVLPRPPQ